VHALAHLNKHVKFLPRLVAVFWLRRLSRHAAHARRVGQAGIVAMARAPVMSLRFRRRPETACTGVLYPLNNANNQLPTVDDAP